MHTIKLFGYLLISTLFLSSCVVNNKIHFNKDFSGTYEMNMELESLLMMAQSMDTTGNANEEDMIAELREELKSDDVISKLNTMEGISNATVEVSKEKGFNVRFDFVDVTALNQSFNSIQGELGGMGGDLGGEVQNFDQFKVEGKKLMFRSPPQSEDEMNAFDLLGGDDAENPMGGMGSMFEINLDFSFDRKIKKVESKGIKIISQEKNRLLAEIDIEEIAESGGYELMISLK